MTAQLHGMPINIFFNLTCTVSAYSAFVNAYLGKLSSLAKMNAHSSAVDDSQNGFKIAGAGLNAEIDVMTCVGAVFHAHWQVESAHRRMHGEVGAEGQ